jgi:hypothetical protein
MLSGEVACYDVEVVIIVRDPNLRALARLPAKGRQVHRQGERFNCLPSRFPADPVEFDWTVEMLDDERIIVSLSFALTHEH